MDNQNVIAVTDLQKDFGNLRAVAGISFVVARGSTTALLGGNGAGKTTTIAMLLGLLLPTSGDIRVLGEDMRRHRYRVLEHINFTSPYLDLPGRLSVAENLNIYARLYNIRNRKRRIAELAEHLDLTPLLKQTYRTLSAGQKTRASLAKALLNHPAVLFLDEPTASLDPDSADRIRQFLEQYQAQTGMTLFMASHNMDEVERMCDNVMIMSQGRIVAEGKPEQLIDKYGRRDLEQVFLDIVRATA